MPPTPPPTVTPTELLTPDVGKDLVSEYVIAAFIPPPIPACPHAVA